jgi:hypothetical protein
MKLCVSKNEREEFNVLCVITGAENTDTTANVQARYYREAHPVT